MVAIAKALDAPVEEFLRAAGHGDLVQARREPMDEDDARKQEYERLCRKLKWTDIGRTPFEQRPLQRQKLLIAHLQTLELASEED